MKSPSLRWFRAGALLIVLFLTACFRTPAAIPVPFPDDPRVLHGDWVMDLELVDWEASRHLYLPGQGLVLAWDWNGESVRGWQQSADEWLELPAIGLVGLEPEAYDPTLVAFVTFVAGSDTGTVSVVSIPAGISQSVSFDLPPGVSGLRTTTGSGHVFLLGTTTTAGPRLYWWDALTGEPAGSIAVPSAPDGFMRSANGRILSFWDLRAGTVHVVDTAAPAQPRVIRLGFCRTNGPSGASSDGRWFALQECNGQISFVDLHSTTLQRMSTGLSGDGFMAFAQDSSELLHVNEAGLVRSFDPVSRQVHLLFQLSEADRHWSASHHQVSLHREADRLVVLSGKGRVLMAAAGAGTVVAELPVPVRGAVLLQLTAEDLRSEPGLSHYSFSGTGQWPAELGAAGQLTVVGEVMSYGLHDYQPVLGTQAAPPPSVFISGTLSGQDGGHGFGFNSTDADAREYQGTLGSDSQEYRALLRRP